MQAVDCAYSVEGSGPALFLIHGIGAARDTWRFALPELVKHFTVISYDLRGHGESPMPGKEFALTELIADLEQYENVPVLKKHTLPDTHWGV